MVPWRRLCTPGAGAWVRCLLQFCPPSFCCCFTAKSCSTLCDPMDHSPPGSSVCGSPSKNTGEGCHFLLWGIFLTQGSNPRLLRWQVDSLPLSHQGISPPCPSQTSVRPCPFPACTLHWLLVAECWVVDHEALSLITERQWRREMGLEEARGSEPNLLCLQRHRLPMPRWTGDCPPGSPGGPELKMAGPRCEGAGGPESTPCGTPGLNGGRQAPQKIHAVVRTCLLGFTPEFS